MSMALSLSDRRSVTRNVSTPSRYDTTLTARVQSVPHRQRCRPKASKMRASGSQMSGKGSVRQGAGAADFHHHVGILRQGQELGQGCERLWWRGGLERLRQAEMVN